MKVSDPYVAYRKGGNRWLWTNRVIGQCHLKLLYEVETVDELFTMLPMRECFYKYGDYNVKPFVLDGEDTFHGLYVKGLCSVCYHTDGIAKIEGNKAFEHIFRSYEGDIILCGKVWYLDQIEEMRISFLRYKEKACWLGYNIKFVE